MLAISMAFLKIYFLRTASYGCIFITQCSPAFRERSSMVTLYVFLSPLFVRLIPTLHAYRLNCDRSAAHFCFQVLLDIYNISSSLQHTSLLLHCLGLGTCHAAASHNSICFAPKQTGACVSHCSIFYAFAAFGILFSHLAPGGNHFPQCYASIKAPFLKGSTLKKDLFRYSTIPSAFTQGSMRRGSWPFSGRGILLLIQHHNLLLLPKTAEERRFNRHIGWLNSTYHLPDKTFFHRCAVLWRFLCCVLRSGLSCR